MKASFKQTVEIRATIQRELPKKVYIGIPRINIVNRVIQKCGCSKYAVMKHLKLMETAGIIQTKKTQKYLVVWLTGETNGAS